MQSYYLVNSQNPFLDPIKDALFLHNFIQSNNTLQDCVYRPYNVKDMCPDPDIRLVNAFSIN